LKNDKVDSATLAHLSRCDLLPEAWMADPATQQMRLQVRLRIALGRQRARSKNLLQGVLHQEGMRRPVSDVLGRQGRPWLRQIGLSPAARVAVDTHLRVIEVLDQLIAEQERALARQATEDARARWLQTVPGVGAYSAMVILAEIGDIARFRDKKSLASYAGLVPRVRESAGKRSYGGISRAGDAALDLVAGGAGRSEAFAGGVRVVPAAAAAQTAASRQGGFGAQAAELHVGVVTPRSLLRRSDICRLNGGAKDGAGRLGNRGDFHFRTARRRRCLRRLPGSLGQPAHSVSHEDLLRWGDRASHYLVCFEHE
jgi:hypothetical protein